MMPYINVKDFEDLKDKLYSLYGVEVSFLFEGLQASSIENGYMRGNIGDSHCAFYTIKSPDGTLKTIILSSE